MNVRKSLDYDKERRVLTHKFALLRQSLKSGDHRLANLERKEAIAMLCIDRKLPKAAINSIHSEIRAWVRAGLFSGITKAELLQKLAVIEAKPDEYLA